MTSIFKFWYPGKYMKKVIEEVGKFLGFETEEAKDRELKKLAWDAQRIYHEVLEILHRYVYEGKIPRKILVSFEERVHRLGWICEEHGLPSPCDPAQVANVVVSIFGWLRKMAKSIYEKFYAPIYEEIYKVFEKHGYSHLLPHPSVFREVVFEQSIVKSIVKKFYETSEVSYMFEKEVREKFAKELETARLIYNELVKILTPGERHVFDEYLRGLCRIFDIPFPGTPDLLEKAIIWLIEWQRRMAGQTFVEMRWTDRIDKVKEIFKKYTGKEIPISLHVEKVLGKDIELLRIVEEVVLSTLS